MIIEKVTYKEFDRISEEHEYYLWHFLSPDRDARTLRSLLDEEDKGKRNDLTQLFEFINIPYFESNTPESMDFLDRLGINPKLLWAKGHHFSPLIVGFKRKRMISSTLETCYCVEGVVDLIAKMDLELIKAFKLN